MKKVQIRHSPISVLLILCAPAYAAVRIVSITPSVASPQPLGTTVTWTVTATDTNPGPLTFQFNVAFGAGPYSLARDFNVGSLSAGTWTSQPFGWTTIQAEGAYTIQVIAKDFGAKVQAAQTATFALTSRVSGTNATVHKTGNPLVALFSAPACPAGSTMRVAFSKATSTSTNFTNWMSCTGTTSMNFYVAGMYPSTAYLMYSETNTGGTVVNGSTLNFTTGPLPGTISFPTFTVNVPAGPQTDTADSVLLLTPNKFTPGPPFPLVASDLSGNILWYYATSPPQPVLLTRPLQNGELLTVQSGPAWDPASNKLQFLRQIDLAGNVIRETNIGVLEQQLLAMGATDGSPCNTIPRPAPVGSACLDTFHHDAIQTLPNGYTAALVNVEKIFKPGTQGDTSGLPVDIIGDMILVLDANWQLVWYWDSFQHDSGPPQLNINRRAVQHEVCVAGSSECPPLFLLGTGIAPHAQDWLHCNSLYYWPQNGDIILSSRNQDWLLKIDYNNGSGTGNVLWRMGRQGDFTFNNIYNDPWPWFSSQHDAGMENNGAGPLTVFDDGNTRVSPPPLGLGSGNSRGMALTVDETNLQVTPLLSVDLGVFSMSGGSAQLLSDGSYLFVPTNVVIPQNEVGYFIEILPTAGTDTGTQVLNLESAEGYRGWAMPGLYNPPVT